MQFQTQSCTKLCVAITSAIQSLLLLAPLSSIQAANPSLEALVPPVNTRGTSFSILARGSSLGNVEEVLFYNSGIQCQRIERLSDDETRLHLVAHDICDLGTHPIRLRSVEGISELRTITISPFPSVVESNDEGPQRIDPNVTVNGTLGADDKDVYQIHASAGQRISAEVVAVRLGVNLLDTVLTLRDSSGKVLAQVDDTPMLNQDPCFSIRAPEDGEYFVEIASVGSNADTDSPYALHIGHFPRPLGVFPLCVQTDLETELTFFQLSTTEQDAIRQRVKLNGSMPGIRSFTLIENGLVCPSPIPIRIVPFTCFGSTTSEHTSSELTTSGRTASNVEAATAPIVWNGILTENTPFTRHLFQVPQDMEIGVEVFASRLGSMLDSIVEIRDNDDQVVAMGDDLESHDTRLVFPAKASSTYTAIVRDKRKQFGGKYTFALEIAPVASGIATFLPRRDKLSQSRQTIAIPQGNLALGLLGVRRDRVNGTVVLAIDHLPTGVQVESPQLNDDAYIVPVVFAAEKSAKPAGGLATVGGSLHNNASSLFGSFLQVIDLVSAPADAIFQPIVVDRLAVAVTSPVPFSIELVQPTIPLAVDGTLAVEVKLERAKGFDSPIDVAIPLLPEWVDCEAKTRIPAGKESVQIILRSTPQATEGKLWPLAVEASVGLAERNVKVDVFASDYLPSPASAIGTHSVSSSLRILKIDRSPALGSIENISAEAGDSIQFDCKLELRDSVPQNMVATIEGLPNRVHVEPVSISQDDSVARFKLVLQADAPTGTFDKLVCLCKTRWRAEIGRAGSIQRRLAARCYFVIGLYEQQRLGGIGNRRGTRCSEWTWSRIYLGSFRSVHAGLHDHCQTRQGIRIPAASCSR